MMRVVIERVEVAGAAFARVTRFHEDVPEVAYVEYRPMAEAVEQTTAEAA
jgi:hypothetical protein